MAKVKRKTIMPAKGGKKAVKIRPGGLHRSTGTPMGKKIPAAKMQQAMSGKLGPLAVKQANMAQGMLKQGQQTAASNQTKKRAPVNPIANINSSAALFNMGFKPGFRPKKKGK